MPALVKIIQGRLTLRMVAVGQADHGYQHISHIASLLILANSQFLIFRIIPLHQGGKANIFQADQGTIFLDEIGNCPWACR